MQLSRYIDMSNVNASTTGASVEVDTQGCEGVLFVGVPGTTVARISTLHLSYAASTTATFVDCSTAWDAATTASGNFMLALDLYKPAKRWYKCTCTSTADAGHWLMAFKYGLRSPNTTGNWSSTDAWCGVVSNITRVISPTSTTDL